MAGQTPSRRQLLQAFACATLASGAPGFVRWSFAFAPAVDDAAAQGAAMHHTHSGEASSTNVHRQGTYKPVFFTPAEYATVEILAELILPRTGRSAAGTRVPPSGSHRHRVPSAEAGATDAGVAEFIDFMASQDPVLHDPFRDGLLWLDTASAGARSFRTLTPDQQTELLKRLAYHANFRPEDKPGQEFFSLMRRYTVMGFYTTRIGLEQLDYPGLQFYGESPAVPQDGSLDRILNT